MNDLVQLQKTGFLTLSRQQPSWFDTPKLLTLRTHTRVAITAPGIIEFTPKDYHGKAIVLSCGIHGNETAPIEILDELVNDLLNERRQPAQRLLVLFGNLPAMDIGERFCEENMNRLFSGAHSLPPGCVNAERRRAKALENAVSTFFLANTDAETRLHYDLHTAIRASKNEKFAVYPLLHKRRHSRSQLAFLAACGVKTILLSESPTTTFSYFSSTEFNAHAFTVELGKVRPFGENDMRQFAAAKNTLTQLVCDASYAPEPVPMDDLLIYRVNQVINKQHDDFALVFDDDEANFTDYSKGTILAEESGNTYVAEYDGEAIVFPNANVAIGQRALLTVVPTTLERLSE
ncbi:succinylglutamate desuccinylase [Alteromonas oceanisediminis]|uniref:succinylglutamate desuccinylase n=1 Tax=Alteromonas oceanisediminis TaxID=2836180 RepID=UPI001BD95090|nr:succinylglutamate desuccinylase [Alteromonas oceanisediminis]MBT0587305.1 succinylglutamate desuccinylase [Alteromonas oceanisediminis]